MIQANEARVGNVYTRELRSTRGLEYEHDFVLTEEWMGKLFGNDLRIALQDLHPIPLSPSVLEDCGFNKSSVENPFFSFYDLKLSRDREISVHNPGTPNEMVFISEQEGYKRKSVVVRNFDYDGKTYLHHLMNIHHSLTGTELIYKPKK